MITVVFKHCADGALDHVIIKGHAGYAASGQDIVCAGISVLTITLLNGLEAVAGVSHIEREVREGYTAFIVPRSKDSVQSIQIDTLIRTFELGVRETCEAYPQWIKVSDE